MASCAQGDSIAHSGHHILTKTSVHLLYLFDMPYHNEPWAHASEKLKAKAARQMEEYDNKVGLYTIDKETGSPATHGVRSCGGVWSTVVYESVFGNAKDSALYVGADIELEFSPFSTITDTKKIWLVQFVRAIKPAHDHHTADGWAIDHSIEAKFPFYGMVGRHKPGKVGWDEENGGVRFARGDWKGRVVARQGRKVGYAVVNASCLDAPREWCSRERVMANGPQTSLYTTYAYDEDNDCWLGGVQWGYTVSWNDETQTAQPKLLELGLRSMGAPLEEEVEACRLWNTWGPEGRAKISMSTSKGVWVNERA